MKTASAAAAAVLLVMLASSGPSMAAAAGMEGATSSRGFSQDHMMLQVTHAGRLEMARLSANATSGNCCGGCSGKNFCSPISSTCYDGKFKSYYSSCSAADGESSTCCGGCAGRDFCSPMSGNCYDRRHKGYYVSCSAAHAGSSTCCGGCDGWSYCSPVSGNCYHGQNKDYYMQCRASDASSNEASQSSGSGSLPVCPGPGNMRVKMLTYNLFWWNLFGRRGGNGGSAGRLVRNAAHGEPFDILGFQECDDPSWIMGDAGLTHEYSYVRWGSNTIAFRKTRWDALANGHEFTAEDRSDQYYGRRGVQWLRLRDSTTGGHLFFIHTHGPLPVNTGGRFGGEAAAHGILGVIARQAGPDDSVVLTGDFNAEAWSSTVRTLEGRIHRIMSDWVDHIFTNCKSGVVETRNLGKGGSDHDALMSIFNF